MADTQYPDNLSILDLENTLKCPVCFELRDGHVYVCQRGHHLCSVCTRSLVVCPTCQSVITNCRNFVVETLISRYGFLKLESESSQNNAAIPSNSTENSAGSSKHTASTSEESEDSPGMPDTQKTFLTNDSFLKTLDMSSGMFPCDLVNCKANNVNLGVGAMIPHLRKAHANITHYLHNTVATAEFTSPKFVFKYKRRYHQAYHISNMGVFFFNIVVLKDGHINMWITTAAASSVALRFQYEISLYVTDTCAFCTSFVGQVHPCGMDKMWLLERNEVMVVPPSQHLLLRDQTFEMDVRVVYN